MGHDLVYMCSEKACMKLFYSNLVDGRLCILSEGHSLSLVHTTEETLQHPLTTFTIHYGQCDR